MASGFESVKDFYVCGQVGRLVLSLVVAKLLKIKKSKYSYIIVSVIFYMLNMLIG